MTAKRFTTNGYYIYDYFKEDKWLVNEVEAEEIVTVMNNLDTKARERSKALSKLQKGNEQLKTIIQQLRTDNTKQKKKLNTTMKENEHIKTTIKDMINTERTELGKMTLRHLWRQIQ